MSKVQPIARRLRVSSLANAPQKLHSRRCYASEKTPPSITPASNPNRFKTTLSPSSSAFPKPRIDYRDLVSRCSHHISNARLRRSPLPPDALDRITCLYERSLELSQTIDGARAEQRVVGESIRAGMTDKKKGATERELWLQRAKKLKGKISEQEIALSAVETELLNLALLVPNDTHPSTPHGPEANAYELERFGPDPIASDPTRDHLSICLAQDWLDPATSALASGTSWAYLKGAAALLELAIVNYAVSIANRHGWTPVCTPDVVKEDTMARCGFVPRDQAGQTYHVGTASAESTSSAATISLRHSSGESQNLVLAATAEIPLAALSANKIHPLSALPIKYVGIGKAFRAEAGARGADTRGMYRLHQFSKVELFAVTQAEGGDDMMEEIRAVQKEVFGGLGLSVRVLDMPTEELGASAYRKYDMEAWMPGRGKWGEISSTSNCADFQARRLHIRYRPKAESSGFQGGTNPQTAFAHTLNGTCAAIPRLLIALIENGAELDADGAISGLRLPQALRTFWIGSTAETGGARGLPITWRDS